MKPDAGKPLHNEKTQIKDKKTPEIKYSFMSMVIARKTDHPKIKQLLEKKGIECEVVEMFSSQKFKFQNNTAVLYHNERFDKLLSLTQSKQA